MLNYIASWRRPVWCMAVVASGLSFVVLRQHHVDDYKFNAQNKQHVLRLHDAQLSSNCSFPTNLQQLDFDMDKVAHVWFYDWKNSVRNMSYNNSWYDRDAYQCLSPPLLLYGNASNTLAPTLVTLLMHAARVQESWVP